MQSLYLCICGVKVKKLIFIIILTFSFLSVTNAQNAANPPKEIRTVPADFKDDGCSMFPDCDYGDCCAEHDRAYFVGGSWKERWRADKKLYNCVAAKKGFQHKIIAPVMWLGVRAFGVSWLPTPFRWGFGQTKKSKSKKNPPKTTTSAIDQSKNVFAVENL
jgi:hypothetical protein